MTDANDLEPYRSPGNWGRRFELWRSTCSRLTDPDVFNVAGSKYYPLTSSLREVAEEGQPGSPDEVSHVIYGYVWDKASKYVSEEELKDSLGDLPISYQYAPEIRDPVADAWAEVGQDMREAAEQMGQGYNWMDR